MTKLYPIKVEGYGTRDVESLPSYLFRSAFAHGLSVGQLLNYMYDYYPKMSTTIDIIKKKNNTFSVAELTRDNTTSRYLGQMLTALSGQDFTHSTMGFLNDSTGRSANEINKEVQWCPACLNDWHFQEQTPYFKLMWQLASIEYCPTHNVALVDQCYKCGAKQNFQLRKAELNHCQKCLSPLLDTDVYFSSNAYKRRDSWIYDSGDIELLFEDVAYYGNENVSYDNLRKSLNHLLDYYWKLDREQELFDVLPMNKLICTIDGIKMISLKVIRRFASQMGISLYDIYTGNAHQTSAILGFNEYCSLPPLLDFNHRESHNHDEVFNAIVHIRRETKKNPLSLKQFAAEANVSVGYLEYRHPALSKQIVRVHQEFQQRLQDKKIQLAKVESLEYFITRKRNGDYMSRKQAYRDLREKTGLPKFKLKDAIQAAYSAINCN